ncbi:MAG: hypothetical protein ACLQVJ_12355 [Syntrophobacteraceae bacterium]
MRKNLSADTERYQILVFIYLYAVFTTGTTLSECARVLKRKGGAAEVHAITVTRALPD